MRSTPPPLPGWAAAIVEPGDQLDGETQLVDRAIELAVGSARHGGGPFGAIVADVDGRVVDVGWNHVVEACDSTAHAEIHAMRRAQSRLGTHDLSASDRGELVLYGSCAPCIQCFGAIYWSGLSRVVTAAASDDAEALGFDEGPVTDELWAAARDQKKIAYEGGAATEADPTEPFRVYEELGGQIY